MYMYLSWLTVFYLYLADQSDEDAASQSVSEFSSVVTQGTQLTAKAIDIPLCCVCLEDR